MLINAPNMLVYFAMVSDGPTTLGLRPQNENLQLEEYSFVYRSAIFGPPLTIPASCHPRKLGERAD